MDGLMAPLLKTAIKVYLKDRFGDRFEADDYELLAEEFKRETTKDEFSAMRKLEGDERRDLIRAITARIQKRINKTGSKADKAMMRRFMKARAQTPASGAPGGTTKRKKKA